MKLRHAPLVCREAVELISDYLEGSLSRADRRRLERHLRGCDACAAYLEQIRATILLTGQVQPEDLEPEVLDGLADLFEQYRNTDE